MSTRNNRILHIDGDSFFASCEIALDPKLEGRPVWVGGGRRGEGIVIAANRLAQEYGIKTGTACFEAKRLCPNGVHPTLWGRTHEERWGAVDDVAQKLNQQLGKTALMTGAQFAHAAH